MNWTWEVVVVPVSDIEPMPSTPISSFVVDFDINNPDIRLVQLTPPGSGRSIVIGRGAVPDMPPAPCRVCSWWGPT